MAALFATLCMTLADYTWAKIRKKTQKSAIWGNKINVFEILFSNEAPITS